MALDLSSIASESNGMLRTSDHTSVVSMNLFVALLCACILLGHLMEESRWMNESITALAIVSELNLLYVIDLCASVNVRIENDF